MTKKELAAETIREFPDASHKMIVKILMRKWPTVFLSAEQTLNVVRNARGNRGAYSRKYQTQPDVVRPLGWQQHVMPRTLSKKREDLIIKGPQRALILSDIHIPYHDETALEAAINYGIKQKPTVVILNGDIGDFYSISRHDKDPRRVLADELDSVRQFLFWLRGKFKKARILYKIGNHEDRMERHLAKNAPALLGTTDFEIPALLKFDTMGIEVVGSLNLIRLGNLPIYHGHELPQGMSSPVNPARGIWMRVQETLLCGHWHRTSEHTEKTGISNKISSCWSTGCLCDMKPDYASVNRWSHGFAVVDVEKDGNFEVHNHKIINGRVF